MSQAEVMLNLCLALLLQRAPVVQSQHREALVCSSALMARSHSQHRVWYQMRLMITPHT